MTGNLIKLTAYNYWANKRIADCLSVLPAEILHTEMKSSFKTIMLTVLHMTDAETIWLERLNGKSPAQWPSESNNNNVSAPENLVKISGELKDMVKVFSDENYIKEIEYNDLKGNPYVTSAADIVQHAVNHSTFHRGQIVTMLRELGIKQIPSTDYITFTREYSGKLL